MRRALSRLLLASLIISILTISADFKPVKASTTIYIRANGSIDPPTANITTSDNVTYVFTSNNYDEIIIERDNIVLDGIGYVLQGTGASETIGIYLEQGNNVTIREVQIKQFEYGIYLIRSSNINVYGNNLTVNYWDGIGLYLSTNNSISKNNLSNNGNGISLDDASDNSIYENNIFSNDNGISLDDLSYNNLISGNNITANKLQGIFLGGAFNNTVSKNYVSSNQIGFTLSFSENNRIYHNNIINNTKQFESAVLSTDFWDNGCEGNYWSNYNGTDLDEDGIGEEYLPWEGVDSYPLMNLYWNPTDINHDLRVDMRDVGRAARAFGTEPGDERWNCHADITGPVSFNPDDQVDMRDIGLVARNFGETYP